MNIDDVMVTKTIFNRFAKEFPDIFEVDVAIAGAGPAGLVAAKTLAEAGKKVVLFERKLSIGGGMWGGGMMFNEIVVQEPAVRILEEFGVRSSRYGQEYYTADAVEAVGTLVGEAVRAGLLIFNCISVE